MDESHQVVQTLLIVYAAAIIINSAIAVKLYHLYKSKPCKYLIGVWVFTLINFGLQAAFSSSSAGSLIAFSTYIAAAVCLIQILSLVTDIQVRNDVIGVLFIISSIISTILFVTTNDFTLSAIPIAIAIGIPQIIYSLKKIVQKKYRATGPDLSNVFAVVLFINGIHFLDYPFLRPHPNAAMFGFAVVLITSFVFGILLPMLIAKHESNILLNKLNESLEHSKELARAKSDFLANMSHEIRTPINGIVGVTEILLGCDLPERAQLLLHRQSIASDNLIEIVNNILSAAQLESGKIELIEKTFSPNLLVKEVVDFYSINNKSPGISISVSVADDTPPYISADKGKILQIIYNLINNALKYSEGTQVSLSMAYTSSKCLEIKIKDDGKGIDQTQQDHIFQKFTQFCNRSDGVGLGLSIVKKLVDLMNGTITMTSGLGIGTEFNCVIPVAIVDSTEALTNGDESGLKPSDETPKVGHALIIEDDHTSQMILTKMLENKGVNADLCVTAEEALDAIKKRHYDIILTDINLPGISGLELIKRIRANDSATAIVVQSAFAFEQDIETAKSLGATDYISKPVKYSEIARVCNQYLS